MMKYVATIIHDDFSSILFAFKAKNDDEAKAFVISQFKGMKPIYKIKIHRFKKEFLKKSQLMILDTVATLVRDDLESAAKFV